MGIKIGIQNEEGHSKDKVLFLEAFYLTWLQAWPDEVFTVIIDWSFLLMKN